jgi:hypothetical protein
MRQASYYGMHALLSTALGVGAIAFGIPAVVTPVWFARLLGIGSAEDPTVATAIRSVGIRDVVIGLGLVRSVRRGDPLGIEQWLLARTAADAGDVLAVGVAVAGGARGRRFLGLGALAVGATALGGALLRYAPRGARRGFEL